MQPGGLNEDEELELERERARALRDRGRKFGGVEGFSLGAADGLTLNTTDEIVGAIIEGNNTPATVSQALRSRGLTEFSLARAIPDKDKATMAKRVAEAKRLGDQARDKVRGWQDHARETEGGLYLTGNLASILAPGAGAVNAVGKGGLAVGKMVSRVPGAAQVVRAASTVAKPVTVPLNWTGRQIGKIPGGSAAMRAIAKGAPLGAGYSAASAAGDATDDRGMAALNALGPGAAFGALFGLGTKAGASTIGLLANVLGRSPDKKALSTLARMMRKAERSPKQVRDEVQARARGGNEVFETAGEYMGPQAEGMQTALSTVPGPAQDFLRQQFSSSIRNMRNTILRSAKKTTGKDPERFHQTRREQEAARLQRDHDNYEAVQGHPLGGNRMPTKAFNDILFTPDRARPHLQPIGKRPAFMKYVKDTLSAADQHGDFMAKELRRFVQMVDDGNMPRRALSNRAINEIDKRMTQDIEVHLSRGRNNDARMVKELQDELRRTDYATGLSAARETSAIGLTAKEALIEGRKAFNSNVDLEDVTAKLTEYPQEVADAFLTGMVRDMADGLANQRNLGDLADAANKIVATPAMRDKLYAALPKTKTGKPTAQARRFLTLLDRVSRHANRARLNFGNSATAPRQAAIEEAAAETGSLSADVVDFIGEILSGQGGKTAQKFGVQIRDRITRPGIYNPRINAALGKRLGAQGKDDILGVMDEIEAWNNRPTPVLSSDRMIGPAARAAGFQAGKASAEADPYAHDAAGARAMDVVEGLERPLVEEYLRPGTSQARRAEIEAMFGPAAQELRALLLAPAY